MIPANRDSLHRSAWRALLSARLSPLYLAIAWGFFALAGGAYAWHMVGLGTDLRNDFWVYWSANREQDDLHDPYAFGNQVLRLAEQLQVQDQLQGRPAAPAISDAGPGLLDAPHNLRTIVARWHRLRPAYADIFRAWVSEYDTLVKSVPNGEYDLDYPPMRLLVMTLWVWHVQAKYPGLNEFPQHPRRFTSPTSRRQLIATDAVAQPLLDLNTACMGLSAMLMFALVWLWVVRRPCPAISPHCGKRMHWPWPAPAAPSAAVSTGWRSRWGDPLLFAPVILLGIFTLLRSRIAWDFVLPDEYHASLIDQRTTTIGFWIFITLRFLAVVCLARLLPHPFRGPACALVAATFVWINPAGILETHGWPQWDAWMCPFILLAALFVSLDCWIAAGLVLGAGAMFKGQILLIAPVLILCPLFAGWPGKFLRIVAGMATGAGLIVWPWLVTNNSARTYIAAMVILALALCILTFWRRPVGRAARRLIARGRDQWRIVRVRLPRLVQPLSILAVLVLLLAVALFLRHLWTFPWPSFSIVLLFIAILTLPWFLPRRLLAAWLLCVFASALWLAAFRFDGKFSWYSVGFEYGSRKQQVMVLTDNSLSNLPAILSELYDWHLHDPLMTVHTSAAYEPLVLDLRLSLAILFFAAIVLCAAGAAIHLRRHDARFLIALTAPCVLLPTLLTQMSARYTVLPAILAASMLAVSVPMSLMALLLTVLSAVMISIKMLSYHPAIAPGTYALFRSTYPDLGWVMLLVSAIFLYLSLAPSRPERPEPSIP